jgi:comEA protein
MTKNERQVVLFILFVLCAGLIFLLLARYRFYEKYVSIEEKALFIDKTELIKSTISTDTGKRDTHLIEKVNINEAPFAELITLPGVGRETALAIIEYRTKEGRFTSTGDLIRVRGIGEKKLETLRPYVSTE